MVFGKCQNGMCSVCFQCASKSTCGAGANDSENEEECSENEVAVEDDVGTNSVIDADFLGPDFPPSALGGGSDMFHDCVYASTATMILLL